MANTISVSVIGDVKDINRKLGTVNEQLSGFQKSVGKVGGLLKGAFAFAAGAAVVKQLGDAVRAGSDLNETLSKSKTIFGPAAADIEKFGNNAAKSLGLSKNEAISGAAAFGNFFDQIGISKTAAAGMSKSFLQMSGDLASFNNADPSQVMDAFQSATRGEYDALQQFIPTINAAKVETEALRLSHKKSAKQLTDADKANALYSLSVKGMGKASGDFARTSGGLANQQRILSAEYKNAQAAIGTALLPILTKLMTFITGTGIPAIQKFAGFWKDHTDTLKVVGVVVAGLVASYATYSVTMAAVSAATSAYGVVMTVVTAAQKAATAASLGTRIGLIALQVQMVAIKVATAIWTAVQWLMNAAMFAFPLVWIIAAIVAVIAIIVLAIKYHKQIAAAVVVAWNAVKTATVTAWNAVKSAISTALNAVKNAVKTALGAVKTAVTTAWNAVKTATSTAWNALSGLVRTAFGFVKTAVSTGISNAIGLVKGIGGKIKSAVGNLGGILKGAGRAVVQGLIDGVTGMIGSLKDKFNSITNLIPSWKGPLSKDKNLLTPAGKAIINGLIKGIDKSIPALRSTLNGVSGVIANGLDTSPHVTLSASGISGVRRNNASATPIILNVTAPVGSSPALIGKELVTYLDAHNAVYGRRWMN